MRVVLALAIAVLVSSRAASADNLPSGTMGFILGGVAGTGADANRLGIGYIEPLSFFAAWHPMTTERRVGWEVRWNTIFTSNGYADAAQVADLQTMQMDLMLGVRVRPGDNPRRYLVASGGVGLFRANQGIPPEMDRGFVGPVTSASIQQYLFGTFLMVDLGVRYGLITGPSQITFLAGVSINGP
jgi:hypothetical protein